jgi:hypothetical protein
MKDTFSLEDKAVIPPYLTSHCTGVNETAHPALPCHALRSEQDWSNSVINEGHFSLEAETVF